MCSWVLRGASWKSWRETWGGEGVNLCPKKSYLNSVRPWKEPQALQMKGSHQR